MATIHVDGKEYQVDDADNLLQACLSLGIDIPYFCWHPALGSVGACRQCAVKQFNGPDDKKGRLVMSCRTPAANNTWISVDDAEAKAFRAGIIEFMMTNHPHDCPVCEEGGHCHLQDMTVMSGHSKRRYRFAKRTHNSQYLGSFIKHEPNRCIACYRCVRYYQDYADGRNFGVFGSHNHVYFGRITDGVLENEFSGNLVEVCPTGVFTDKTHSDRYNRKWDMLFAPSVCQQCAVGCNISPGERYGEIRRVENRYNGAVNHYFLCDRGRFGYGYVNAQDRPRQPQLRNGQELQTVTPEAAITGVTTQLREAQRIIGIGSPRASLEANFQLRELVGTDNFYSGMNATELALTQQVLDILQTSGARTPSLREMEDADAVFILGEDVTQTAPRISLAIRQASKAIARKLAANKGIPPWHAEAVKSIANDAKYPVFIASFAPTRLQDVAKGTYCATAEDIARLGFAVANAIDPQAPAVTDLKPELATQAQEIATALLNAERPLLVSGTGVESAAVLQATANIAQALRARGKNCELTLVVPEVNSLGAAMLGGKALETALSKLAEN
ncbi:NADH dehydrogenase, partial [Achromatium sp. WMS2]